LQTITKKFDEQISKQHKEAQHQSKKKKKRDLKAKQKK
jgi:hypothetical protein